MSDKNFWLISLCALLALSNCIGLNIFMRIAIGANAIVILIDVMKQIWRMIKDGRG